MRALVTGGGGFVGRSLAFALKDRGWAVRTFARSAYPELEARGVEHVQGDIRDPEEVLRAAEGCDAVFHVAAKVGIAGTRAEFEAVNVAGTDHVLRACEEQGVGRLVFTSTPSVVFGGGDLEGVDETQPYPDHYEALYPETKAEAERRVTAADGERLHTVSLRPHLVWGPGDTSLLPRVVARAPRLRRIGPGGKLADISYIDDVVEAHLLAEAALRERPEVVGGRTYFISSGEPVEIWTFVDALLEAAGRPPLRGRVPLRVARVAAWLAEGVHRLGGGRGEPFLSAWVVEELTTHHHFDIGRARAELGYAPRVGLDDGKRRLAAWIRDTGWTPEGGPAQPTEAPR